MIDSHQGGGESAEKGGEFLPPVVVAPVINEEDAKQDKRRKKALAWVLIVNSIVGLAMTAWLGSKGVFDSVSTTGIIPAIIDITIAIALFRDKAKGDILKWVLVRSILGLALWGFMLITKNDWVTFVMQIPYFGYLIYHSKVKATARSFRVAMGVLVFAVVVMAAGTIFAFYQGKQTSKEFDAKLTVLALTVDNTLSEQQGLIYSKDETQNGDIKALRKQILDISAKQKIQLEQVLLLVDEGLKKFPDAASQKNLTNLKALFEAEVKQNLAVVDLFEFVESVDEANITPEQEKIYSQKELALQEAYREVTRQAQNIQNSK